MSTSVCCFCGELKQGAFTQCRSCGEAPVSETELTYAAALSSHHLSSELLQRISREILQGRPLPPLPEQLRERSSQVARQWMEGDVYKLIVQNRLKESGKLRPEIDTGVRAKSHGGGIRYSIGPSGEAFGLMSPNDLSISISSNARNPVAVARQMTLHVLKRLGGFMPDEWRTLEEAARTQGWIEKRGVRLRYADVYADNPNLESVLLETAIAEEYGYMPTESKEAARLQNHRLEQTIFERIDSGEIKRRCEA